jgi:hypothetical protein
MRPNPYVWRSHPDCNDGGQSGKIKDKSMKGLHMEPILTIRYTPEKRDYVRASRTLARKSTGFLVLAAVTLLVMISSAVILVIPAIGGGTLRRIAIIALLVGVVYVLYYLFLVLIQLNRAFNANETLRMERKLTFFDDHLRMKLGDQAIELPWENFKRVIDGGEYFLLIYEGSEQVYPFIPDRAFTGDSTKQAFLEFIRAKSIPVI